MKKTVYLVTSGDLRESANRVCWPAQWEMEQQLGKAVKDLGYEIRRAHPFKKKKGHGFISSQREGLDVFAKIPPKAPLVVAESVWQYSHHVLPGLLHHQGPILLAANWSGQWPGLVGTLNLRGCLAKAGIDYSLIWGEDFTAQKFRSELRQWLARGSIRHDTSHVRPLKQVNMPTRAVKAGKQIAADIKARGVIMGIFDEGCMGMYNAIIPDELLFPMGIYKERLSQSALYAAMREVSLAEAKAVLSWLAKKGMKFQFGRKEATELTLNQVLEQCRMYIAACRIGDAFGCEAIGIQYQQGLKDLCPASDLAEGLLNNADRPPVRNKAGVVIRKGKPFTHFNEVDECAGLDGILTQRVHTALNQPPENTLHDIRWGDWDQSGTVKDYVWVFEISGAAPPAHFIGGYKGAVGARQTPMYFPLGGSTVKGVSKPGEIIWSRVFIEDNRIKMDIGRGHVAALPTEETERRLRATTYEWPLMHAVLRGVTRDQMMARHRANHIQVAYANSAASADLCLLTKAAVARELGIEVLVCDPAVK